MPARGSGSPAPEREFFGSLRRHKLLWPFILGAVLTLAAFAWKAAHAFGWAG